MTRPMSDPCHADAYYADWGGRIVRRDTPTAATSDEQSTPADADVKVLSDLFEQNRFDALVAHVAALTTKAKADALRQAADEALTMYDPPVGECIEWSEWLRARADREPA